MNKKIKIISTVMLAIILITMATTVFADGINPGDLKPNLTVGNNESIMGMAGRVMGLIRNASVIIGVIILMVIGVKFMLGSAEEKADYKKSLVPLVVGIVIVMAATSIMSFVFSVFTTPA